MWLRWNLCRWMSCKLMLWRCICSELFCFCCEELEILINKVFGKYMFVFGTAGFIYNDEGSKLAKSIFKSVNTSISLISKVIIVLARRFRRLLIVRCIAAWVFKYEQYVDQSIRYHYNPFRLSKGNGIVM